MLKEAIEALRHMALDAAKPYAFKPEAEPTHVYCVASRDGSITRMEAEPAPRRHHAADIHTLCSIARDFAGDSQEPVIWYAANGVTLFLDDHTRRDTVLIPLKPSHQLSLLTTWGTYASGPVWHTQGELARKLRVELAGALEDATLIEALRRVRVRVNQSGDRVIEHGRASIGKSLEAELTAATALPEEVTCKVHAFAGNFEGLRVAVRCALEVDAENERFALIPFAGELADAWHSAEDQLGDLINDTLDREGANDDGERVKVYRGSP